MTFTVSSLSRCSGGNHYKLAVTVGAVTYTINLARSDLALDPTEVPDAVLARCRSAAKEAGATTFAAADSALTGKTFQV